MLQLVDEGRISSSNQLGRHFRDVLLVWPRASKATPSSAGRALARSPKASTNAESFMLSESLSMVLPCVRGKMCEGIMCRKSKSGLDVSLICRFPSARPSKYGPHAAERGSEKRLPIEGCRWCRDLACMSEPGSQSGAIEGRPSCMQGDGDCIHLLEAVSERGTLVFANKPVS